MAGTRASTACLEPAVWLDLERAHHAVVDRLVAGHLTRSSRGEQHPVEDFLFSYYSFSPAKLRRWHPHPGTVLLGDAADRRLEWPHHVPVTTGSGPGVVLDVDGFLARRGPLVRWVRTLLTATASRPAQLSCFGLHEWAMVYRLPAERVRHAGWPLRLGPAGTDAVVERHRIRCTHVDAFRFFAEPARGLNAVQPTRAEQLGHEQPGCLHATMDLYRWAYKLAPAVPSELLLACFLLARDVRELDMRASPYDLSRLGYRPVPIETAEGRAAYVGAQREFAERAVPLRTRLVDVCDDLLAGDG
jgi:hypothetical protein